MTLEESTKIINLFGRTYTDDCFTHFLLRIKKKSCHILQTLDGQCKKNFGLERLFTENEKLFKALISTFSIFYPVLLINRTNIENRYIVQIFKVKFLNMKDKK